MLYTLIILNTLLKPLKHVQIGYTFDTGEVIQHVQDPLAIHWSYCCCLASFHNICTRSCVHVQAPEQFLIDPEQFLIDELFGKCIYFWFWGV